MTKKVFWELGLKTIQELENEKGILASGREEIYGCLFGRDSLITALKLIRTYSKNKDPYFLNLVDKILVNLAELQGREENIESGEQPGKIIHEYRSDNHEHLTKHLENPWYVYPDGTMRIYDSVDATPLFLIALYRYWQQLATAEQRARFEALYLPAAQAALDWLLNYGDSNKDGFIDYQLDPRRKHGGLLTQNWMDSVESVFHEDGADVAFPIAPVEVQGYAYLALRLWAKFFARRSPEQSSKLSETAANLKRLFNARYVLNDRGVISLAWAIDGAGKPLASLRSNIGHLLWAGLNYEDDGELESILERPLVPKVVKLLLSEKIFEPKAGIRTLAKNSRMFRANSYHNGSIWPHDNSIIAEGLRNFGYVWSARRISSAILKGLAHFRTAIELFCYEFDTYFEYRSASGQTACKKQAWSAATLLQESAAKSILLLPSPRFIKGSVYNNVERLGFSKVREIYGRFGSFSQRKLKI